MQILYCNVGEMKYYNGIKDDSSPQGGGAYNKNNVGHEANNFTNHNGIFYGFVQSPKNSIKIERLECSPKDDHADDVLVVWIVKKKWIVGYYKNARVYRKLQFTPAEIAAEREHGDYNITTDYAVLIPEQDRNKLINYTSRINIWYGDEATNKEVFEYIEKYDSDRISLLRQIDDFEKPLIGTEREAIVKIRENQSQFRKRMLERYKCKCCLCGVSMDSLLIASHIKPWSRSDDNEKLSADNGLLLCPNHDKLFDLGYISFDDDGNILISNLVDKNTTVFMNINYEM